MSTDKGHGSELGGLVTEIGGPKTDADGNLINSITGKVHTHNATGELAEGYANRGELIDAGTAINHTHRITVRPFGSEDDVTVQQGLEPPTRYAEQENARLAYLDGPRTSTPQQPATGGGGTPSTGGQNGQPRIYDFTKMVREGNGQFKSQSLEIGPEGIVLRMRSPKSLPANGGPVGGYMSLTTNNFTPQQGIKFSRFIGAEVTPLETMSNTRMNFAVGGSDPNEAINVPLDTDFGLIAIPEDLKRSAQGVAAMEGEVAMPFRGAQWAQTTWWD